MTGGRVEGWNFSDDLAALSATQGPPSPDHPAVRLSGARQTIGREAADAGRRIGAAVPTAADGTEPTPSERAEPTGTDAGAAALGSSSAAAAHPYDAGHHRKLGQPHDPRLEGPIASAEALAGRLSTPDEPLGPPGPPVNWRTPFFVGMAAAAGVAVTVGLIQLALTVGHILLLVAIALFLAIGLEPAVSWLVRHRWRRGWAVLGVLATALILLTGLGFAAIPPLVDEVRRLVERAPGYLEQLRDRSTLLGELNQRFGLQARLEQFLGDSESGLLTGLAGAGLAIFGVLTSTLIVVILMIYFLADFPRIRVTMYRFVPADRRPRAILLGDEILAKVGSYVLGNAVITVIAAVITAVWLVAFGVPYPLLLAVVLALLNLIPTLGSTLGGILVAVAAFSVSAPAGIATVIFLVAYRFAENYLLAPRVFGTMLQIPALVTVVAILLGGTLIGVVGALVAIPVAAAVVLLIREIVFPRLDRARAARGAPPS